MIYKRYELSLSQNGPDLVHIARNAAGNVIFRESSEEKLKKAIDQAIQEKQKQEEFEAKKKSAKAKAKKQKRGLFTSPPELVEDEEVKTIEKKEDTENETEPADEGAPAPPQARVTRGSDGKFISKSTLQEEEPKKKSFWDKLK